jgi:hypothetical protein
MSTFYLHIGFPKTATTFLQDVVFPEATSLNFLKTNGSPRKQRGAVRNPI